MFRRTHLCAYDLNLTYPQNGIIPDPPLIFPTQRTIPWTTNAQYSRRSLFRELQRRGDSWPFLNRDEQEYSHRAWKRDLSLRTNGTIDPWVSSCSTSQITV